MAELSYKTRIYYDDTDAGGVVYYANYLKLCERAKQEFFLKKGCDLFKLHNEGLYLIVKEVKADYISSLRLGDEAEVYVSIVKMRRASVDLFFEIMADGQKKAQVYIKSVMIDRDHKIVKLPDCFSHLT